MLDEVLDDLHVAVFRRAHQRRRAVFVADVDVGAGLDQQLDHVQTAVADGQHQGGLAVLSRPNVDVAEAEQSGNDGPVGFVLGPML
jgi:hypothetical protein